MLKKVTPLKIPERRCRSVCFGDRCSATEYAFILLFYIPLKNCPNCRNSDFLHLATNRPISAFIRFRILSRLLVLKPTQGECGENTVVILYLITLPFITSKLHSVYDSPYSLTSRFRISNIDCSILREDNLISSLKVS